MARPRTRTCSRSSTPNRCPVGVEYTGDLAAGVGAELDALAVGFRERTKREDERFRLATDSEFWFALCFKSLEDKKAFLKAARLTQIGDKYLDGRAAA